MGFRFRFGPFTFGRSGIRLSLWGGGSGVSIPLTGKGRTFGKVGVGPLSWYGESGKSPALSTEETAAIEAFEADQAFLERLQRHGMPWRGVQERLKEALPQDMARRDHIAYGLVPAAMNAVFGQQSARWDTEKRPSKSGSGQTTWIIVRYPT